MTERCSSDIVERLRDQLRSDHARGCMGRQYSCECGYDLSTEGLLEMAAIEIERLRGAAATPCPGCDGHECDAGCQYPGATKGDADVRRIPEQFDPRPATAPHDPVGSHCHPLGIATA